MTKSVNKLEQCLTCNENPQGPNTGTCEICDDRLEKFFNMAKREQTGEVLTDEERNEMADEYYSFVYNAQQQLLPDSDEADYGEW